MGRHKPTYCEWCGVEDQPLVPWRHGGTRFKRAKTEWVCEECEAEEEDEAEARTQSGVVLASTFLAVLVGVPILYGALFGK